MVIQTRKQAEHGTLPSLPRPLATTSSVDHSGYWDAERDTSTQDVSAKAICCYPLPPVDTECIYSQCISFHVSRWARVVVLWFCNSHRPDCEKRGGGEKRGTHKVTFCKTTPSSSVTAANTAALEVAFLNIGHIGITGMQETVVAIHATLNATRLV